MGGGELYADAPSFAKSARAINADLASAVCLNTSFLLALPRITPASIRAAL
jgi:hypothetical protein